MPPTYILQVNEVRSLNASHEVLVELLLKVNTTEAPPPEKYDAEGAMEFIVATLLVYSLVGIVGMMVLRIRKRGLHIRSSKKGLAKEEHVQRYIKMSETIRMQSHKEVLQLERKKFEIQLKRLESRASRIASISEENRSEEQVPLTAPSVNTSSDQDLPSPRCSSSCPPPVPLNSQTSTISEVSTEGTIFLPSESSTSDLQSLNMSSDRYRTTAEIGSCVGQPKLSRETTPAQQTVGSNAESCGQTAGSERKGDEGNNNDATKTAKTDVQELARGSRDMRVISGTKHHQSGVIDV